MNTFEMKENTHKSDIKKVGSLLALGSVLVATNLSPQSAHAEEVIVKKGDTLSELAEKHGSEIEIIKKTNHIDDENKIQENDIIIIEKIEDKKEERESTEDVTEYVVKSGDTLGKIGEKFNLDYYDIMEWNGLDSDLIFVGDTLSLVKPEQPEEVKEEPSEHTDSVAQAPKTKKHVAQASEVDFSEDVSQNTQSQNTQNVESSQPNASATPNQNTNQNTSPRFNGGSNPFPYGECTNHAFSKRASMGKGVGNWGNASNWVNQAIASGYNVNNTPSVGAIIQSNAYANGSGYYGHVGIVEAVHNDGSITISESNWNGNRYETFRTIPASQVSSHNYIH